MDTGENAGGMEPLIDDLVSAGALFGYRRSKRHPSTAPFIFGTKGGVDIFDLEKTKNALFAAEEFVRNLARSGKTVLFVGGKKEAHDAVRGGAQKIGMPFVAGRWIGGTLTNFSQIRGRVDTLLDLRSKREKGEFAKYTKRERLLLDREIARLEELFGGIVALKEKPAALFVVDSEKERTSVVEAKKEHIPVVSLSSSDCDLKMVDYAIPGNDASRRSIAFFVARIVDAYERGKPEARPGGSPQTLGAGESPAPAVPRDNAFPAADVGSDFLFV